MNELPAQFSGSENGSDFSGFNPMAYALGGIGAGVGSFFTSNPSDYAMPYLNNAISSMGQYYSPYLQGGQQAQGFLNNYMNRGDTASNILMNQYGSLANNPTGVMNRIGSTFQPSPGYNWQLGQSLNAANRVSAAGGMAGSPAEQQQAASVAQGLANQDYYNYLNHGIGMYNTGLGGLNSMANYGYGSANNMYGIGANMANQLAQNLAAIQMSQANLAYSGAENQNQTMMGGMGALSSGIGSVIGDLP